MTWEVGGSQTRRKNECGQLCWGLEEGNGGV